MKFFTPVIFLLLLAAATPAQESNFKIENLRWLSGCWQSNNKNVLISEQWTGLAGQAMFGIGTTVKKDKLADFEFMRIMQNGSDIFYIAKPAENKEETSFKLTKSAANEAVFENPEHDFPQKIIYRLENTNLFARIEGNNKGKFMGIDFPMVKTKCD